MAQRIVDLAEIIFQRIDEKNTRKTSVLRARILEKYENEQNAKYFVEFFRAVFKCKQNKKRAYFLTGVYIDVHDLRKT